MQERRWQCLALLGRVLSTCYQPCPPCLCQGGDRAVSPSHAGPSCAGTARGLLLPPTVTGGTWSCPCCRRVTAEHRAQGCSRPCCSQDTPHPARSLFPHTITCTGKLFLAFRWSFVCISPCPCSLVLLLGATERNLLQLGPHHGHRWALARSLGSPRVEAEQAQPFRPFLPGAMLPLPRLSRLPRGSRGSRVRAQARPRPSLRPRASPHRLRPRGTSPLVTPPAAARAAANGSVAGRGARGAGRAGPDPR